MKKEKMINSVDEAILRAKELGCVKYKIFHADENGNDPLNIHFFNEEDIEMCFYNINFRNFTHIKRNWDYVFLHSKHMSKFYEIEKGYIFSENKDHSILRNYEKEQ